jgi:hypothetical protein
MFTVLFLTLDSLFRGKMNYIYFSHSFTLSLGSECLHKFSLFPFFYRLNDNNNVAIFELFNIRFWVASNCQNFDIWRLKQNAKFKFSFMHTYSWIEWKNSNSKKIHIPSSSFHVFFFFLQIDQSPKYIKSFFFFDFVFSFKCKNKAQVHHQQQRKENLRKYVRCKDWG